MTGAREELAAVHTFPQLVRYLRDELDWPISTSDFEDLVFDYSAEDLGIDAGNAAKIQEIKRLRPLSVHQPWGIFFVKFEPKRLPVVALRRILSSVALKKRASANRSDQAAWAVSDLLFISNYGDGDARQISFAHFSQDAARVELPTLKVLGWNNLDTSLHVADVAEKLTNSLVWPTDVADVDAWRAQWDSAFTLRHREVVTTSREMAVRLADLARVIRNRITSALAIETTHGPLTQLMRALQRSLVHDLDADGFADVYAQTIAYGLLSARIADPEAVTASDLTGHMRTNPLLRDLMQTFLHVGGNRGSVEGPGIDFDELGVSEVVELLNKRNMEAVLRDFGDRNPEEDPVIQFYELFFKEYDPRKRIKQGVFYTPRPVVSYIAHTVDEALRTELGLVDGLADTTTWAEIVARWPDMRMPAGVDPDSAFVQILDPATGTGTFLVEVIDIIHRSMMAKWRDAGDAEEALSDRWNAYVAASLLPRLHGFELSMAPYAIAHLKVGLKLYETGYRFSSDERARVYLTNSLEPAEDFSDRLEFAIPALADETLAVNEIKRMTRFTVVLGNPPYSASITEPRWLMQLLGDWKQGLAETKSDLNREEWKFLRYAQYQIQTSGAGVLGFVINRDFLDGITKRVMREDLGKAFRRIRVVDLNGDVKGNIADENVFEIEQGVAIVVLCVQADEPQVEVASQVGTRQEKYAALLARGPVDESAMRIFPAPPYFRWMRPGVALPSALLEYASWPSIDAAFAVKSSGIQTKNDAVCIGYDPDEVLERVNRLVRMTAEEAQREFSTGDGATWDANRAQADLRSFGVSRENVRRILYRPFDWRYVYYTHKSSGFLGRPRFEVMRHMLLDKNIGLIFNRQIVGEGVSQFGVSRDLICHGTFYLGNKGQDYLAPLYVADDGVFARAADGREPNLTPAFMTDLARHLGDDQQGITPEDVLAYVYAVFYSPTYRARYGEFVKMDFPRLPFPGSAGLFRELAVAGRALIGIHLMETPSANTPPSSSAGLTGATISRVAWSNDTVWLDSTRTGTTTVDGTVGFEAVPYDIWAFRIGGYQVCEKWLKDRRGRTLSDDDVSHYWRITAAVGETMRLMGEIDEVINQYGGWPTAFVVG
jgi:hypothetical protein